MEGDQYQIEIIKSDDPKELKLNWTVHEEPAECWVNLRALSGHIGGRSNLGTHDKDGRFIDEFGVLLDSNGNQKQDEHGNYMLAKDFPK